MEVDRVTSDGVDQSTFDFHFYILPSSGSHDEFRLRFRTEGNDSGDDWFIDDVSIGIDSCPGDTDGSGAVDFTDLITVLSSWGPCPGCPADLDGDGEDEGAKEGAARRSG